MTTNPGDGQSGAPPDQAEQRRQPKQSRSQETFNSILRAGAELFEERGYEQTTTHQIAARAGVSVGALYRYFEDKQAILLELHTRETSALRGRVLRGFHLADIVGQDLVQLVHKALVLAFSVYSERPGLRRVLAEQSKKIPALVEQRVQQEAELRAAVVQILRSVPDMRLDDVETGAYLITLFMESLIEDYLLYHKERGEFDDERIIAGATRMLMRFVLASDGET